MLAYHLLDTSSAATDQQSVQSSQADPPPSSEAVTTATSSWAAAVQATSVPSKDYTMAFLLAFASTESWW